MDALPCQRCPYVLTREMYELGVHSHRDTDGGAICGGANALHTRADEVFGGQAKDQKPRRAA